MGVYGPRFAWSLYAINFVLVGILVTAVWAYAARTEFLTDEIDARTARLITVRGLIAPAVFALSIAVAAVSLSAAFFGPPLIGPLQAVWIRHYRRGSADADERDGESDDYRHSHDSP